MMIMSICELLCLTKAEILEIRRTLRLQLDELPSDCVERVEATATLANIEMVLARPEFLSAKNENLTQRPES